MVSLTALLLTPSFASFTGVDHSVSPITSVVAFFLPTAVAWHIHRYALVLLGIVVCQPFAVVIDKL